MKETINATVRKVPFYTAKMASVSMTCNDEVFDAKAFQRSASAMQALQALRIGDEVRLAGHWEANPKNGYKTFIVDAVGVAADANVRQVPLDCQYPSDYYHEGDPVPEGMHVYERPADGYKYLVPNAF